MGNVALATFFYKSQLMFILFHDFFMIVFVVNSNTRNTVCKENL